MFARGAKATGLGTVVVGERGERRGGRGALYWRGVPVQRHVTVVAPPRPPGEKEKHWFARSLDGLVSVARGLRLCRPGALELERSGQMKPAGMGRGQGIWHSGSRRGDSISWITDGIKGDGKLPHVSARGSTRAALHGWGGERFGPCTGA